jgi:hypothetical protein
MSKDMPVEPGDVTAVYSYSSFTQMNHQSLDTIKMMTYQSMPKKEAMRFPITSSQTLMLEASLNLAAKGCSHTSKSTTSMLKTR